MKYYHVIYILFSTDVHLELRKQQGLVLFKVGKNA